MREDSAIDALVDGVYGALLGESSWQSFLDGLRQTVPNGKAALLFHDAAAGVGGFSLNSGMDPEAVEAYDTHYSRLNPWMHGATTRPVGRVVRADEMLPQDRLVRTDFYHDYLLPQDIRTAFGVTICRETDCNFMLSILCDDVDESTSAREKGLLQALVPHLQRAVRFYRRERPNEVDLFSAGGLSRATGVGVVRVTKGFKVRSADETASALCDSSRGVWIDCAGRFRCSVSNVMEYIDSTLNAWADRRSAPPSISYLSATEDVAPPIRITVLAPFLSHDDWYFRGPECVVLLEELKSDLDRTVEEFGQFYKLTGAEMRTVAGLSRGLCLNEISASVGVSVETARAQLKAVFRKSGTHRQAELVAVLAQFRSWQ